MCYKANELSFAFKFETQIQIKTVKNIEEKNQLQQLRSTN